MVDLPEGENYVVNLKKVVVIFLVRCCGIKKAPNLGALLLSKGLSLNCSWMKE